MYGYSGLLRLAWKLVILPISITAGVVSYSLSIFTGSISLGFWVGGGVFSYSLSIITGSISLGFWVASGVFCYSLSMIGVTTSGRRPETPPSTSGRRPETPPSPPVSIAVKDTGQTVSLLREFKRPVSTEEMLEELQSVLEESIPDCNGHVENKQLQEQKGAYPAALEADQARKDQNQHENEDESARLREKKVLSLGPEPEKGLDVIQVLVRLPNGERIERRFYCKVRLQNVYDFVDSSGCLEAGSYMLATFFPRVVFGEDQLSSTLEELGMYPLASLFVQLKF